MERKKIKVYTKLDNNEEINEFLAIKNEDVIKYIDFSNNIMVVDMQNNIIKRENDDYIFTINFVQNDIDIIIKKLKKNYHKSIKVLLVDKTKKSYLVRYLLEDENILNEYCVNF